LFTKDLRSSHFLSKHNNSKYFLNTYILNSNFYSHTDFLIYRRMFKDVILIFLFAYSDDFE